MPFLILLSCGLLVAQPAISRRIQPLEGAHAQERSARLHALTFVCAVYGGYFGAGLGIALLAVLALAIEDDLQRLNALKGVLSLVIGLAAVAWFAFFGPVEWTEAAIVGATSLVGRTGRRRPRPAAAGERAARDRGRLRRGRRAGAADPALSALRRRRLLAGLGRPPAAGPRLDAAAAVELQRDPVLGALGGPRRVAPAAQRAPGGARELELAPVGAAARDRAGVAAGLALRDQAQDARQPEAPGRAACG